MMEAARTSETAIFVLTAVRTSNTTYIILDFWITATKVYLDIVIKNVKFLSSFRPRTLI
jgi:hypothetical protein